MDWEDVGVVAQIPGSLTAVAALAISWWAVHVAPAKAGDIDAGTHSIAYREHGWTLHKTAGLQIDEIEKLLKRETFREGGDYNRENAYEGSPEGGGYKREVGSVREVLDPLGRRGL